MPYPKHQKVEKPMRTETTKLNEAGPLNLTKCIAQKCLGNVHRFLNAVKLKSIDLFRFFAQNMDRGYMLEPSW